MYIWKKLKVCISKCSKFWWVVTTSFSYYLILSNNLSHWGLKGYTEPDSTWQRTGPTLTWVQWFKLITDLFPHTDRSSDIYFPSDRPEVGEFWVCHGKVGWPRWKLGSCDLSSTYCLLRVLAAGNCFPAIVRLHLKCPPEKPFQPQPCWCWAPAGRSTCSRPLWIQSCGQRNRGSQINRLMIIKLLHVGKFPEENYPKS